MARAKGSANLAASLEVLAGAPLDARLVVNTKTDLTASGSYPYSYVGMVVSVQDEEAQYMLTGSDPTDTDNWKKMGGDVETDSELSPTSENPVQNKAIKAALDTKQDTLSFDNTPASGSLNPVTSGGLYTALHGKVDTSKVGVSNGVAELDATGKVPSSQLPSYVDDVVEGYYNETDGKFYEESSYSTEITGESGKIYVSLDTSIQYRWTGSAFSALGGALTLGETSSTAYRGDRGKQAYEIATQDIADFAVSPTESAYSVGKCIIYENVLYRVTSAIAAGDTLTPGGNILATKMANEITMTSDEIDTIVEDAADDAYDEYFGD